MKIGKEIALQLDDHTKSRCTWCGQLRNIDDLNQFSCDKNLCDGCVGIRGIATCSVCESVKKEDEMTLDQKVYKCDDCLTKRVLALSA